MKTARQIRSSGGATSPAGTRAFTLVEILIAVGILAIICGAIYSTWTAILRSTKVGLDAAAAVQRTRIAVRNIEDSLAGIQSFVANQGYYGFVAENGSEPLLSFVAKLPDSFPRSGKFGDLDVRRVAFSLESSSGSFNYNKRLVMRQSPVMMDWDEDEKEHPLVLARHVQEFTVEFQDPRTGEFLDEWVQTNQLPKLVRFTLKVADSERARRGSEQEIVRYVNLPSSAVQPQWQRSVVPGQQQPGVPPGGGQPGALNNPLQGSPLQPVTPPGGMMAPPGGVVR
jgi:prepilin-type N-terminal cleavage/methylation domain-containing protein